MNYKTEKYNKTHDHSDWDSMTNIELVYDA